MKKISQLLFIGCLVVLVTSQTCVLPAFNYKIKAAIVQISGENFSASNLNTMRIQLPQFRELQSPEFIISTESFSNFDPSSGIDYKIEGDVIFNRFYMLEINVTNNVPNSWKHLTLSYLFSDFSELILGSYQIYRKQPNLKAQGPQSSIASFPAYRLIPLTNYAVAVFISGLKTNDPNYKVQIVSQSINTSRGQLLLDIDFGESNVQYLKISYVIYERNHDIFYYFEDREKYGNYMIRGPIFMNGKNLIEGKFSICGRQSQTFCEQTEIFFGGVCTCQFQNQIKVNGECVCADGLQKNIEGKCVKVNVVCGENESLNKIEGKCECIIGFIRFNQQCIEKIICPSNNLIYNYESKICEECPPNSISNFDQTQCVCQQGYRISDDRTSCVLNNICPENSAPDASGRCVCTDGFYSKNNLCLSIPNCPTGATFVLSSQECQCKNSNEHIINSRCQPCGQNEVWNGNACVCAQNAHLIGSQCVVCPANSVFRGNECVCSSGFFKESDACVACDQSCAECSGSGNNRCTSCQNSLELNNGVCRERIECGQNEIKVENLNACNCINGFQKNSQGLCIKSQVTCPNNQILNPQTSECDCKNGYTRKNGVCQFICQANEEYSSLGCRCVDGYYLFGSSCQKCPINSVFDTQERFCVCQGNRYLDLGDFVCKECQENSSVNAEKNNCECNFGFELNKNTKMCEKIVECPENSAPDASGRCVCTDGFYSKNNLCLSIPNCPTGATFVLSSQECQCKNSNEHIINSRCQPCGQNEVWNGNACVCAQNAHLIGSQCLVCPANSVFRGNECVCSSGFFKEADACVACDQSCAECSGSGNNRCTSCQNSLELNNGVCRERIECGQNEIKSESSNTCQCTSGYIRRGGICEKEVVCKENEHEQNNLCVCDDKYYKKDKRCILIPNCPTGATFVLSSQECQCKKSNEHIINSRCQPCGQNEVWNGNACVCAQNAHLIGSQCLVCPANSVFRGNECVCSSGFFKEADACVACDQSCAECSGRGNNRCTSCQNSLELNNGVCRESITCGVNQQKDEAKNICNCIKGFTKNAQNICIKNCLQNQILNLQTNQCQCKQGFQKQGSECLIKCQQNEQRKNGACECISGAFKNASQCVLCPSRSTPNSQQSSCICQGPNIFNAQQNTCVSCPANSAPNSRNQCQCNSGFSFNSDRTQCTEISSEGGAIFELALEQFPIPSTYIGNFKFNPVPDCLNSFKNKNISAEVPKLFKLEIQSEKLQVDDPNFAGLQPYYEVQYDMNLAVILVSISDRDVRLQNGQKIDLVYRLSYRNDVTDQDPASCLVSLALQHQVEKSITLQGFSFLLDPSFGFADPFGDPFANFADPFA